MAAANAWLAAETDRILAALSAAGIEALLLKGAALAGWIYPDPGQRRMGDIDLLLRRSQIDSAQTSLEALGYSPALAEPRPGSQLRFESQRMMLRRRPPATLLELHWQLFDEPYYQDRVSIDWFWARARPASMAFAQAQRLDTTAMLLHLCGHLALHHPWAEHPRLRWQHDIAAIVALEGDSIETGELLDRARQWQLVGALRQTILPLAEAPWCLELPAGLAAPLAALRPGAAERRVLAARQQPLTAARRLWCDLRGMRGWRRRLAFLGAQILPGADYMRWRYGDGPLPALYLSRWKRGLRQLWRGRNVERNADSP